MNIQITNYTENYKKDIENLFIELQEYERELNSYREDGLKIAEQYINDILTDVENNNGKILLAIDGDVVCGFIIFILDKEILNKKQHLYISDLIVSEKFRAMNLGRILMEEAEKHARNLGIEVIRVGVLANSPTRSFYKKLGYSEEEVSLVKNI